MNAIHIKEAISADERSLRVKVKELNFVINYGRYDAAERRVRLITGWNVHPGRIEFVNEKNQVLYIYERKLS